MASSAPGLKGQDTLTSRIHNIHSYILFANDVPFGHSALELTRAAAVSTRTSRAVARQPTILLLRVSCIITAQLIMRLSGR